MTHSARYGWWVWGVDATGKPQGLATKDEAAAVRVFWKLADQHPRGKVTFYAEERTLWLDENSRLVVMGRVDFGRAVAFLHRQVNATADEPTEEDATDAAS